MHPVLSQLPLASIDIIETSVRPKFEAYFGFTRSLCRVIPDATGAYSTYPDDSMMSDLTVLAALFGETYEATNQHQALTTFATALTNAADLRGDLKQIVNAEGYGSFWILPGGRVSDDDAVSVHLELLLRTLRNGFLHFHWRYEDLSALQYWNAQHWATTRQDPTFDLPNRPQNNYMAYIADGHPWNPNQFWSIRNLRILVTRYTDLRYFLHSILQQLLTESRFDIFGNERP
jgi:hypothetical protein